MVGSGPPFPNARSRPPRGSRRAAGRSRLPPGEPAAGKCPLSHPVGSSSLAYRAGRRCTAPWVLVRPTDAQHSCARATARGCETPTCRRSRCQATPVRSLRRRVPRRPAGERTLDPGWTRVCTAACGRGGRETRPQTNPGREAPAACRSVQGGPAWCFDERDLPPRNQLPREGSRSRRGERGLGGDQAWLQAFQDEVVAARVEPQFRCRTAVPAPAEREQRDREAECPALDPLQRSRSGAVH